MFQGVVDVPQSLLAFPQRLLRPLLFADVPQDLQAAGCFARGVRQRGSRDEHVQNGSVLPARAQSVPPVTTVTTAGGVPACSRVLLRRDQVQ